MQYLKFKNLLNIALRIIYWDKLRLAIISLTYTALEMTSMYIYLDFSSHRFTSEKIFRNNN
jgi:hypothetical protein